MLMAKYTMISWWGQVEFVYEAHFKATAIDQSPEHLKKKLKQKKKTEDDRFKQA